MTALTLADPAFGAPPPNFAVTPTAYWPTTAIVGGFIDDLVGSADMAAAVATIQSASPLIGTLSYVRSIAGSGYVLDSPNSVLTTGTFTIAGWFRVQAAPNTWNALLSQDDLGTGFVAQINNGDNRIHWFPGDQLISPVFTYPTAAFHFCVTRNAGNTERLYFNGALAGSIAGSSPPSATSALEWLRDTTFGTRDISADLCEPAVWNNIEFSAAQVLALYQHGLSGYRIKY